MTEPPTNPFRMPERPIGQPPAGPPTQPHRHRRGWVLPVVAVAVVVLLAGGVGGYLWYGKRSATTAEPNEPKRSFEPAQPASEPVAKTPPDVCSMIPKAEADRLVPEATVAATSRESEYTVTFQCTWDNQRIDHGEYWRQRTVEVKVDQYKPDGARTGRAMAQNSYDLDYGQAKYSETYKPTPSPGEKDYTSQVRDIPGVGDGAFAQYFWRRSGKLLWYSWGEAKARVDDMTIEVKFQASQQRKDAAILNNESTQSITEENALREVSGLVAHVARGVAQWKAQNPGVLAKPRPGVTLSPSARPSPSQSTLAAMPTACQAIGEVATSLVPGATTRTRAAEEGNDSQTECRWLNLNLPDGKGKKIRSVLITMHRFANRAGLADPTSAKGYYTEQYGGAKRMQDFEPGDVSWDEPVTLDGLGEAAFMQYIAYRRSTVFNGSTTVTIRQGALVVEVSYAGSSVPAGEGTNSPKVKLMDRREADEGAQKVARAFMKALAGDPGGS
ncbi:hypothetical protein [Thermoactinospora rubra]|uniref:hypothetical protein n=1 Tax=Thermoactinospora rubra TaxID=1088767 RepID=UPI000A114F1F|nr:hypothetical protein [Thermoactinospora rubra]